MEFRFEDPEDAALVKMVIYKLHETFAQPVVEVVEGPTFELKRSGWGMFTVYADMHLHDGRVIQVHHDLNFQQPETFRTVLQPLRPRPAGFELAAAAEPHKAKAVVRSTFLFTDGQANVGITTQEALRAATTAALDELGAQRCSLSTFGFGKDHNADLLECLAKEGCGSYCYIESEDQIGQAFGEALGGLLSTTHQNVRLTLTLAPGIHVKNVCTDFSVNKKQSDDGSAPAAVNVEIGDLFAAERRDILFELEIDAEAMSANETTALPIGQLGVRAFSVLATHSEESLPLELAIERRPDATTAGVCNPHVERHRCRFLATDALKKARASASSSLAEARQVLQHAAEALGKTDLAKAGDAVVLGLRTDINDCLQDLGHEEDYRSYGSKKMGCLTRSHGTQRGMNMPSTEIYSNHSILARKAAFGASVK